MNAKGAPPSARFAIVSNPGTLFERIEQYCGSLQGAQWMKDSYDTPVDIMRIEPNGELTTEF